MRKFCQLLNVSVQASIDKMPWTEQKFVSQSSRGWKSKTRMPAWLGSVEPLQGCRCQLLISSHEREQRWVVSSPHDFYKDTNPIHEGPSSRISSSHDHLPKASPNTNAGMGRVSGFMLKRHKLSVHNIAQFLLRGCVPLCIPISNRQE